MGLVVVEYFFQFTNFLSKTLQHSTIDFVKALREVSNLLNLLRGTKSRSPACHGLLLRGFLCAGKREKIDEVFGELYSEAERLANKHDIEMKMPRTCGRQTQRSNVPADSLESYYRRSVAIPFLDHLISSMEERFGSDVERAFGIAELLPDLVVNAERNFEELLIFHNDDLPKSQLLKAKAERWVQQ